MPMRPAHWGADAHAPRPRPPIIADEPPPAERRHGELERGRAWCEAMGPIGCAELPYGSAITSSGRISAVTEPGELSVHYPFPTKELVILDNALKFGSRNAKARFAVYIGDLGEDTAATARELLARVPTPDNAVLLAVSPNQKAIEGVYGAEVKGTHEELRKRALDLRRYAAMDAP